MIACLTIPAFGLRAALLGRDELRGRPVAFGPEPGSRPLVGSCTTAASEAGVFPSMRLSEALASCPDLVLLEPDPAGTDEAWEAVVHRLEEAGFAVEPDEPGCAYFETDGIERLAGGLDGALRRALDAVGALCSSRRFRSTSFRSRTSGARSFRSSASVSSANLRGSGAHRWPIASA